MIVFGALVRGWYSRTTALLSAREACDVPFELERRFRGHYYGGCLLAADHPTADSTRLGSALHSAEFGHEFSVPTFAVTHEPSEFVLSVQRTNLTPNSIYQRNVEL